MFKERFFSHSLIISIITAFLVATQGAYGSSAAEMTAAESADADLSLMKSAFAQQFPGTTPSSLATTSSIPKLTVASDDSTPYLRENAKLVRSLLAKAKADECFNGIGVDYPAGPPCLNGGVPKINEGYVWGLAQSKDSVWFGTGANVQCLVNGTFLGSSNPTVNSAYVCEHGQSSPSRNLGIPAAIGDMRPPHIYKYDIKTKVNTDLSQLLTGQDLLRLRQTIGLRSVGILDNSITYLAGPSLTGINIFAFNFKSGAFLGSTTLTEYTNIRRWLPVEDSIYTGVANRSGGGSVLKFKPTTGNPFAFKVVGSNIDGEAAELALHKNRIYVSTWPNAGNAGPSALNASSIWISPRISDDGLTTGQQNSWKKSWSVSQYEADPVTAKTYGGGAMFSYRGDLYWGTMHVPFLATIAKWGAYGQAGIPNGAIADVLGTFRATSLFRVDDFSKNSPKVELLYGQSIFPVWDPTTTSGPFAKWTLKSGAMGAAKFGLSGFGNPFNNYTWSMQEFNNQLFVGTMDWSYLIAQSFPDALNSAGLNLGNISLPDPALFFGADLWSFKSDKSPAKPQSISGVGNYLNYGIRTMASDSRSLYLGTANPMNLMTEGGWELLAIKSEDD